MNEQKPAIIDAQPATEAVPEPVTLPVLTPQEQICLLKLQRQALSLQSQKVQTDAAFEKAITELNGHYQSIIAAHPGYSFDAETLLFTAQ
jgi:hypothetical protein